MTWLAQDVPRRIHLEPLCTEGHPLVEPDVAADDAGFADHHARAVVYAEEVADLGSGMDVDSGFGVGHLGDQPRKERHAELQQGVGKAVVGHRREGRIAENYLLGSCRGGVSVEDGLNVGAQTAPQFGNPAEEPRGGLLAQAPGLVAGLVVAGAVGQGDLLRQDIRQPGQQLLDGPRVEISGEDRRAEEPHGPTQDRRVDAGRGGRRNVAVRSGEGRGYLPEPLVGVRCSHSGRSVL